MWHKFLKEDYGASIFDEIYPVQSLEYSPSDGIMPIVVEALNIDFLFFFELSNSVVKKYMEDGGPELEKATIRCKFLYNV